VPRGEVVARVEAAVRSWLLQAGMRPLVIATHRMALTLWLATVVPIPDPGFIRPAAARWSA
jgi:broad specificity phosphatase PhoE